MIPGLQVPPTLFGTSKLKKIEAVAYSTSNASTIVVPSNIRKGDLLVLFDYGRTDESAGYPPFPSDTVPGGFTKLNTRSITWTTDPPQGSSVYWGHRARLTKSLKLATGLEGGTTLSGIAATGGNIRYMDKFLVVFRGNLPISGITLQSAEWNAALTRSNPPTQIIAAAGQLPPVLCLAAYGHSSPESLQFSSDGVDVRDGHVSNESNNLCMVWRLFTDNPVNISVDMPTLTLNRMFSGFLLLS